MAEKEKRERKAPVDEWYTTSEVAEAFGVSTNTVRTWIENGTLREGVEAKKENNRWYIHYLPLNTIIVDTPETPTFAPKVLPQEITGLENIAAASALDYFKTAKGNPSSTKMKNEMLEQGYGYQDDNGVWHISYQELASIEDLVRERERPPLPEELNVAALSSDQVKKRYMTSAEVAEFFNTDITSVNQWAGLGKIKGVRVGGKTGGVPTKSVTVESRVIVGETEGEDGEGGVVLVRTESQKVGTAVPDPGWLLETDSVLEFAEAETTPLFIRAAYEQNVQKDLVTNAQAAEAMGLYDAEGKPDSSKVSSLKSQGKLSGPDPDEMRGMVYISSVYEYHYGTDDELKDYYVRAVQGDTGMAQVLEQELGRRGIPIDFPMMTQEQIAHQAAITGEKEFPENTVGQQTVARWELENILGYEPAATPEAGEAGFALAPAKDDNEDAHDLTETQQKVAYKDRFAELTAEKKPRQPTFAKATAIEAMKPKDSDVTYKELGLTRYMIYNAARPGGVFEEGVDYLVRNKGKSTEYKVYNLDSVRNLIDMPLSKEEAMAVVGLEKEQFKQFAGEFDLKTQTVSGVTMYKVDSLSDAMQQVQSEAGMAMNADDFQQYMKDRFNRWLLVSEFEAESGLSGVSKAIASGDIPVDPSFVQERDGRRYVNADALYGLYDPQTRRFYPPGADLPEGIVSSVEEMKERYGWSDNQLSKLRDKYPNLYDEDLRLWNFEVASQITSDLEEYDEKYGGTMTMAEARNEMRDALVGIPGAGAGTSLESWAEAVISAAFNEGSQVSWAGTVKTIPGHPLGTEGSPIVSGASVDRFIQMIGGESRLELSPDLMDTTIITPPSVIGMDPTERLVGSQELGTALGLDSNATQSFISRYPSIAYKDPVSGRTTGYKIQEALGYKQEEDEFAEEWIPIAEAADSVMMERDDFAGIVDDEDIETTKYRGRLFARIEDVQEFSSRKIAQADVDPFYSDVAEMSVTDAAEFWGVPESVVRGLIEDGKLNIRQEQHGTKTYTYVQRDETWRDDAAPEVETYKQYMANTVALDEIKKIHPEVTVGMFHDPDNPLYMSGREKGEPYRVTKDQLYSYEMSKAEDLQERLTPNGYGLTYAQIEQVWRDAGYDEQKVDKAVSALKKAIDKSGAYFTKKNDRGHIEVFFFHDNSRWYQTQNLVPENLFPEGAPWEAAEPITEEPGQIAMEGMLGAATDVAEMIVENIFGGTEEPAKANTQQDAIEYFKEQEGYKTDKSVKEMMEALFPSQITEIDGVQYLTDDKLKGMIDQSDWTPAMDAKLTQETTVTGVIDGDTLVLGTGRSLRFDGYNAPERGQPGFTGTKNLVQAFLDRAEAEGLTLSVSVGPMKTEPLGNRVLGDLIDSKGRSLVEYMKQHDREVDKTGDANLNTLFNALTSAIRQGDQQAVDWSLNQIRSLDPSMEEQQSRGISMEMQGEAQVNPYDTVEKDLMTPEELADVQQKFYQLKVYTENIGIPNLTNQQRAEDAADWLAGAGINAEEATTGKAPPDSFLGGLLDLPGEPGVGTSIFERENAPLPAFEDPLRGTGEGIVNAEEILGMDPSESPLAWRWVNYIKKEAAATTEKERNAIAKLRSEEVEDIFRENGVTDIIQRMPDAILEELKDVDHFYGHFALLELQDRGLEATLMPRQLFPGQDTLKQQKTDKMLAEGTVNWNAEFLNMAKRSGKAAGYSLLVAFAKKIYDTQKAAISPALYPKDPVTGYTKYPAVIKSEWSLPFQVIARGWNRLTTFQKAEIKKANAQFYEMVEEFDDTLAMVESGNPVPASRISALEKSKNSYLQEMATQARQNNMTAAGFGVDISDPEAVNKLTSDVLNSERAAQNWMDMNPGQKLPGEYIDSIAKARAAAEAGGVKQGYIDVFRGQYGLAAVEDSTVAPPSMWDNLRQVDTPSPGASSSANLSDPNIRSRIEQQLTVRGQIGDNAVDGFVDWLRTNDILIPEGRLEMVMDDYVKFYSEAVAGGAIRPKQKITVTTGQDINDLWYAQRGKDLINPAEPYYRWVNKQDVYFDEETLARGADDYVNWLNEKTVSGEMPVLEDWVKTGKAQGEAYNLVDYWAAERGQAVLQGVDPTGAPWKMPATQMELPTTGKASAEDVTSMSVEEPLTEGARVAKEEVVIDEMQPKVEIGGEMRPATVYHGTALQPLDTFVDAEGNLVLRPTEQFGGKVTSVSFSSDPNEAYDYATRVKGMPRGELTKEGMVFEISADALEDLVQETGTEFAVRGEVKIPAEKWRIVNAGDVNEILASAHKMSDAMLVEAWIEDNIRGEYMEWMNVGDQYQPKEWIQQEFYRRIAEDPSRAATFSEYGERYMRSGRGTGMSPFPMDTPEQLLEQAQRYVGAGEMQPKVEIGEEWKEPFEPSKMPEFGAEPGMPAAERYSQKTHGGYAYDYVKKKANIKGYNNLTDAEKAFYDNPYGVDPPDYVKSSAVLDYDTRGYMPRDLDASIPEHMRMARKSADDITDIINQRNPASMSDLVEDLDAAKVPVPVEDAVKSFQTLDALKGFLRGLGKGVRMLVEPGPLDIVVTAAEEEGLAVGGEVIPPRVTKEAGKFRLTDVLPIGIVDAGYQQVKGKQLFPEDLYPERATGVSSSDFHLLKETNPGLYYSTLEAFPEAGYEGATIWVDHTTAQGMYILDEIKAAQRQSNVIEGFSSRQLEDIAELEATGALTTTPESGQPIQPVPFGVTTTELPEPAERPPVPFERGEIEPQKPALEGMVQPPERPPVDIEYPYAEPELPVIEQPPLAPIPTTEEGRGLLDLLDGMIEGIIPVIPPMVGRAYAYAYDYEREEGRPVTPVPERPAEPVIPEMLAKPPVVDFAASVEEKRRPTEPAVAESAQKKKLRERAETPPHVVQETAAAGTVAIRPEAVPSGLVEERPTVFVTDTGTLTKPTSDLADMLTGLDRILVTPNILTAERTYPAYGEKLTAPSYGVTRGKLGMASAAQFTATVPEKTVTSATTVRQGVAAKQNAVELPPLEAVMPITAVAPAYGAYPSTYGAGSTQEKKRRQSSLRVNLGGVNYAIPNY